MPFMDNRELSLVKNNMVSQDRQIQKLQRKVEESKIVNNVLAVTEGVGGGFAVGFLRGKLEDKATGQWNIPGTSVDIESLFVAALAGLAVAGETLGLEEKWTRHIAFVAAGVGGHYAGQIARKLASTGQFSMVAGGLPQFDPVSYNATQFSSPYADPVSSALSSAGV